MTSPRSPDRAFLDYGLDQALAQARTVLAHAYAPYSRFAVGAALLLDDGRVVTATNFENASTGLSLCAETVACALANSQGDLHRIVAVAIVGGAITPTGIVGGTPVRPCGRCRQILNEAAQISGRDLVVHCASADGAVRETHLLSALLPYAFGPNDLALTRAGAQPAPE